MSDVVVFHLVGNADLALRPGEATTEALGRIARNPDDGLIDRRADHPQTDTGPLPKTIHTLNQLGHRVARIVLFVTQQSPPHPNDTVEWAPILTRATATLSWLNREEAPIDITTATVTNFSIAGFADITGQHTQNPDTQIVVPISGGATSAFLGLLIGTINAGVIPFVLPIGKGDTPTTWSPTVDIDAIRWFSRRRMWTAIAALPNAPDHIQQAARDLDHYERKLPVRGRPHLPADHLHRLIATTASQWAADDPIWPTGLKAITEVLTERLIDQALSPAEKTALEQKVRSWQRRFPDLPQGRNTHIADICDRMASKHTTEWAAWKDQPEALRTWMKASHLPRANRLRHEQPPVERSHKRQDTKAFRVLMAASQGTEPRLRQPTSDPMPNLALRYLDAGLPDSPVPGTRLAIRLAGVRNANGAIDEAVLHHHRDQLSTNAVDLPITVIASDTTGTHGDIIIDPNDLDTAAQTTLAELRRRATDLELRHRCRITTMALYLNQGTKVMNYAALRATLTVATELGATLELLDVAASNHGASTITALPTGHARTFTRHALAPDVVRGLLHGAIHALDLVQALTLAELLDDADLQRDVAALADLMLWPLQNTDEGDHQERLRRIVPATNAYLAHRQIIGERATVVRLSTLLSAAVADKNDERWNTVNPQMKDLWRARNAVFHDKPFTYPANLTAQCINDVARALGTNIGHDTIDANAAISRRQALLDHLHSTPD